MKRNAIVALVGVALICGSSLLATSPAEASGGRFAVGASVGYQWPIVQDDADPGATFGLKGRVALTDLFEVEPNIIFVKNGDVDTEFGGTLPAPDVVHYALNGVLRLGAVFELTAGLGWASVDVPSTGSQNKFAWNGGLGVAIPVGLVAVEIGGRLLVINTESGASRKHGLATAGVLYRF